MQTLKQNFKLYTLEKKYKKLFRHRHVTNVIVDSSTELRVYYRYKGSYKSIKDFLMKQIDQENNLRYSHSLQYIYSTFADQTKNYIYAVAYIRIGE